MPKRPVEGYLVPLDACTAMDSSGATFQLSRAAVRRRNREKDAKLVDRLKHLRRGCTLRLGLRKTSCGTHVIAPGGTVIARNAALRACDGKIVFVLEQKTFVGADCGDGFALFRRLS